MQPEPLNLKRYGYIIGTVSQHGLSRVSVHSVEGGAGPEFITDVLVSCGGGNVKKRP